MSFEQIVEDVMIDTISGSRHPGIDVAFKDLSRNKYTNPDFDDIFKDVVAMLDELDVSDRHRDFDKLVERFTVMLVCEWAEAEHLTDDLNDREMRKVEQELDNLEETRYKLEEGRDGGRRGSRRSSGRRGGSSRRDDDFRTGDRSSRGRSSRRDRDDDRGSRRSSRGSKRGSRRSDRDDRSDEPKTAIQRQAELRRDREENRDQERPKTPGEIRRENKRTQPAEERSGRNYDFVGESETAKEKEVTPMSQTEEELGFAYTDVPVGSLADYVELGINIEDKEFIKTRPIDREETYRDVIYDPSTVQPVWALNEKGLRVLRWREFNMNIDNHVIPDFTRSQAAPRREQNALVIPALAQPTRRSILDIAKEADKADRNYEDSLGEWEVNNKDRADDEKDPKPESPALQKLGRHTLRVDEPIHTSSLADMIQETMAHFSTVRTLAEGDAPVESFGQRRRFAYVAKSTTERDDIMSQLEMFSTAHQHRTDENVVPIHKYHEALMAVVDTIPYGMWKRINRRMTAYVNDIFNVNLGLGLTIDDFAMDGDKVIGYLNETYGEHVMKAFIVAHAGVGGRISMLEAGKGDNDLMIYEVEGTQVTILPVAPEELQISSVQLEEGTNGKTALVTSESNQRLFNALRTVSTQSTPTVGKQTPYKYIAFSDGSVYRIDRNAMCFDTKAQGNPKTEFLLTQVSYS